LRQICSNFATFTKYFWNSLVFSVTFSPVAVGRDQNVSVLLKVSLPAGWSQFSEDLQQCVGDMDLTTGM